MDIQPITYYQMLTMRKKMDEQCVHPLFKVLTIYDYVAATTISYLRINPPVAYQVPAKRWCFCGRIFRPQMHGKSTSAEEDTLAGP